MYFFILLFVPSMYILNSHIIDKMITDYNLYMAYMEKSRIKNIIFYIIFIFPAP